MGKPSSTMMTIQTHSGEAVLQNAVTEGAAVTSVNIMVFDYYIAREGVVEMGTAAENAANATTNRLAGVRSNSPRNNDCAPVKNEIKGNAKSRVPKNKGTRITTAYSATWRH